MAILSNINLALDSNIAIFTAVIALLSYIAFALIHRRRYPLPPGPKGLPILGCLFDHPKTDYWETYKRWDQENGDRGFIYFHLLGRRMLILNTLSAAEDLLIKRSANYSDRPFLTMAGKLMGREKSMFVTSYNDRLRKYRKLLHQSFNSSVAHQYWPLQEQGSLTMIDNILTRPELFLKYLRRNAVDTIMRIAFGYSVSSDDDQFVARIEEAAMVASVASRPGTWLVDSFPILRFVPEWFPGAGFKRNAREWKVLLESQALEPHEYVKKQLASGTAHASFTSKLLQSSDTDMPASVREDLTLWTAGALFAAGADTTVSASKTFFFAMMLYPEVQAKAQQEVDALMEKEQRLPMINDRHKLPYLEAILKEVLRFVPATPLGLPHLVRDDDIYEGFFIPAGTTVIGNIWAITHNPATYPNPSVFDPDRYLGAHPQPDPRNVAFGFGRRVCSGQHVAESAVWIQMALALATLNIGKIHDKDGRPVEPDMGVTTSIVSHVKPFKCDIKPRSSQIVALVKETLHAHS